MSVSLLLHCNGTDGSTTFVDSSPNPKTVAVMGNAKISTTQSKFGGSSLYLDGSGDELDISSSTEFNLNDGDFTIEMWFYEDPSSGGSLMCRRSTSINGWVLTAGGYRGMIDGVGFESNMSWTRPSFNAWHHFAFVRAGSTLYAFIDGVQAATRSVASLNDEPGQSLRIGVANSYGEAYFKGYLDDIRFVKGVALYTTAFTPPNHDLYDDEYFESVSLLLRFENDLIDKSLVSNTAVSHPSLSFSSSERQFGSYSMSNSNRGILYANPSLIQFQSSDFTIECWIKMVDSSFTFEYGFGTICCWSVLGVSSNGTNDSFYWSVSSSGTLSFYCRINGTDTQVTLSYAGLTAADWTTAFRHLAVSRNGTTLRMFIDGVQVATQSITGYINDISASGAPFGIGAGFYDSTSIGNPRLALKAYFDEFRITNGVGRYSTNFTPPTTEFWYPSVVVVVLNSLINDLRTLDAQSSPSRACLSTLLSQFDSTFVGSGVGHLIEQIQIISQPGVSVNVITSPEIDYLDRLDGGTTTIEGCVTVTPDRVSRRVALVQKRNGRIVRMTASDPNTGYYRFDSMTTDEYFIWSDSYTGLFDIRSHLGIGVIEGTVTIPVSRPVSRRVVLLEYLTYIPVAITWSDSETGFYRFSNLDTESEFTVIAEDALDWKYNDIIRSRVRAH